jgi:hypothetical protein
VIGAISIYEVVDYRWLRLGQEERNWFVILLSAGPAVALLVAVFASYYA